ncbi:hypothetical protein QVD17_23090 [Tagetes erecta]|uniref:Transferase, Chloramphenicol acetyltransferase-like domain protein n=1 Tax=Tagetes erecta TaxID=13708 RepID=A0AAD8NU23_TARER|nr:hypothetical protein QVD17_23090 [Tagetes erecta]
MKMTGYMLNIVCREIMKPSSPTPSHLKTYNLSPIDQFSPHIYMTLILFYPNNESCSLTADEKAQEMKKSLSQSLTRYYPFAGRLPTPTATYVDCNDEGVVFVEAKSDTQLSKFQSCMNDEEDDNSFHQLFADGMVWQNTPHATSLVGIQLNHFACGGMAVAVSMSHRIGDSCTLSSYVSHWASVARYGSTDHKQVVNPCFIQFPTAISSLPEVLVWTNQTCNARVTRKFVFPNSKLNELKNKVLAEAGSTVSINKPTRVEVLISLLYKTLVATTSQKSGSFKPTVLVIPMDTRNAFVPKVSQTTVGNFAVLMMVMTSDTSLSAVVSEIKKKKMERNNIQSFQQALQNNQSSIMGDEGLENVANKPFYCSSLCGFPCNKVDFGWGKPTVASASYRSSVATGFVLTDTPNEDGIEANVTLEEQDMKIFQAYKEMLSYCQS